MTINNTKLISQQDNYANDFGEVLRSSSIFYFKKNSQFKTTISFLNYWKLRTSIEVLAIANIRTLEGALLKRERLNFEGTVINYSPQFESDFEGSIEIEIFSLQNIKIPYAAIMAVYEAEKSISIVHTYSRLYSHHELEEQRTISNGHEACIPLVKNTTTKIVMHNGLGILPAQQATISIKLPDGETQSKKIQLPSLRPYETFILPINDLDFWSGHKFDIAEAYLDYTLANSFTRLLCLFTNKDGSELQATHTDFNYSIHKTDTTNFDWAQVPVPDLNKPLAKYKLITWGANEQSKIIISDSGTPPSNWIFNGENLLISDVHHGNTITYKEVNNKNLPSRIHNAIYVSLDHDQLPAICNLGVYHRGRPPKRMWWGIVGTKNLLKTGLSIHALEEIYGNIELDEKIYIRLYSSTENNYLEFESNLANLLKKNNFDLEALFPNYENFTGNDFGYISVYSNYPGLIVFTYVLNKFNSISLEHGF